MNNQQRNETGAYPGDQSAEYQRRYQPQGGQRPPVQGGYQPPIQQQPQPAPQWQQQAQARAYSQSQYAPTQQPQPAGPPPQVSGPQQMSPPQSRAAPRSPRLQPLTVEELVQTDVATAERDSPIQAVVAQMGQEDVGSVVVVEGTAPVGIVTDRQIALALESTPDLAERQVDELLSGDLVTGTTDMTVFDALRELGDKGIRRLPIVEEDGSLQGIVTLDDILVLLGNELNNATQVIEQQSPRL